MAQREDENYKILHEEYIPEEFRLQPDEVNTTQHGGDKSDKSLCELAEKFLNISGKLGCRQCDQVIQVMALKGTEAVDFLKKMGTKESVRIFKEWSVIKTET